MKTNSYIKYSALIIIFITCFNTLQAQVPGFMGKRITVSGGTLLGYSFLGGPAKVGSTAVGADKKFYLGADLVISRKWTMGAEYQRMSTAIEMQFDWQTEQALNQDFTYALKANTLKFYFSHFGSKSNYLAPVGRYFTIGMLVLNYTVTDTEGYLYEAGKDLFKGSNLGFTIEIGKKRVFYKHLVLDYGLQAGLVLPKKASLIPLQDEFAEESANRLLAAHLVNFKLGLGWLL